MANNPQITVEVTPSLATTTDGTSTVTVLTCPMHDSTGAEAITFDIVGYEFSTNEVASAKIMVKVTNTAGTLAMVGTPVHIVPIQVGSSTSLSTAVVTVVVSGSNVLVKVIGVTGKTIKWVAYRNPAIEVLNSWVAVTAPEDGYVNTWVAADTRWNPISRASLVSGIAVGGDLSGTLPNPTVDKLDGATVPAAGSLTTGNVLQVSGSSALTYAPLNLAGGSNYVTGALPLGGDVTGGHSANTVTKIQGRAVTATAPSDGYVLAWSTGSNNWYPANGIPATGAVSGDLAGFLPSPTVLAITGDGTGVGSDVDVKCRNLTFTHASSQIAHTIGANNDGEIIISGGAISLYTTASDDPIFLGTGGSTQYGLTFNGSNLPNVSINGGTSQIQWANRGGYAAHDYTLYIGDNGTSSGYGSGSNFYISGQKGEVSGATAHGGSLYLSAGLAGTGGIDGYVYLRSGTTTKLTIGPATTIISNATISLPDITTSSTIGAAGAASALPATPEGYISVTIAGTVRKIPYYLT